MDLKSDGHPYNQKRKLGEFIKSQRKLAQLSLRELAERTDISNPYLSQIERGLHEPSVRILRAISKALNVSLTSLLSQLGHAEESAVAFSETSHSPVETAVYSDPLLSQYQKEVLVATYKTFVSNSRPGEPSIEQSKHKRHDPKLGSKKPKGKVRS